MLITRFTQSCLLIEEGTVRILIDPSAQESDNDILGKLDAVLYTHEHSDHFDADLAQSLADSGAKIYANASTAKLMISQPEIVADSQEFEISGIKIKAIELLHCLMPDGSEGPQNTGYLINDKLFDPGDGKELEGLQVDNLALPITGPDISMKDSFSFASQVKAGKVIPVHYDVIGANPRVYAAFAERMGFTFKFVILDRGQSTEI